MSDVKREIVEMSTVDPETGDIIKINYPTTIPAAIKGFEENVTKICKNTIKSFTLSISGDGTNIVTIPAIDGYTLIAVLSLSGTSYMCNGTAKNDNNYVAEIKNDIAKGASAQFECIYASV